MAASSVIPARTGARTAARADRGLVARTAARTAPRGPGLAPVVALPLRPSAVALTPPSARVAPALPAPVDPGIPGAVGERPALRLVPPAPRGGARLVRRLVLLATATLVVALLVLAGRAVLAEPAMPVAAGHVVLEPGETLWDVAVRSAPTGVDPREQLEALRLLNGFGSGALDAWTVVLIPAR